MSSRSPGTESERRPRQSQHRRPDCRPHRRPHPSANRRVPAHQAAWAGWAGPNSSPRFPFSSGPGRTHCVGPAFSLAVRAVLRGPHVRGPLGLVALAGWGVLRLWALCGEGFLRFVAVWCCGLDTHIVDNCVGTKWTGCGKSRSRLRLFAVWTPTSWAAWGKLERRHAPTRARHRPPTAVAMSTVGIRPPSAWPPPP